MSLNVVFVFNTLAILVYSEKEIVFTDIYNPNRSIFKIIDIIRPVDECEKIEFSARQNAENEHCETIKKLVHKLNYHY